MNFVITSLGRCGTLSLATLLATNKNGVVVRHEVRGDYLFADAKEIVPRFVDNYGEVNSYLRHVLNDIPVEKKAVVLRHPYDILLSAINWRKTKNDSRKMIDHINDGLVQLDKYVSDGTEFIKFEHMVSEGMCLQNLIGHLGLDCTADLPATHKTGSQTMRSIRELDEDLSCFQWFIDTYYRTHRCDFCED